MGRVINWELMKNPVNWIIVVLMVMLGAMAARYLFVSAMAEDTGE